MGEACYRLLVVAIAGDELFEGILGVVVELDAHLKHALSMEVVGGLPVYSTAQPQNPVGEALTSDVPATKVRSEGELVANLDDGFRHFGQVGC